MKLKVYENRQLEIIQEIGTQNENNVELIELEVPEQYENWNKKIVFVLENEIYWDFIDNETYLINKAITKNKEVGIYVWLTNEDKDFRTITKTMYFNSNKDASEQITLEEEAEANRFIAYIEGEKQELEELINEVQTKLNNGEFNGADGKDGKDGSNGYSPIIRTIETTDGYDLEITDINGTRTITILNGKNGKNGLNGQDGAKGEKGDPGQAGANGKDGYTPVRGIDYWTNQDIATIESYCANYIDANINQAIGGSY